MSLRYKKARSVLRRTGFLLYLFNFKKLDCLVIQILRMIRLRKEEPAFCN